MVQTKPQMSSRDKILKAIKANKPAETVMPAGFSFETIKGDLTEKYMQVLQGIGGEVRLVDNLGEVAALLSQKVEAGEDIVNGIESLSHYNVKEYAEFAIGAILNLK